MICPMGLRNLYIFKSLCILLLTVLSVGQYVSLSLPKVSIERVETLEHFVEYHHDQIDDEPHVHKHSHSDDDSDHSHQHRHAQLKIGDIGVMFFVPIHDSSLLQLAIPFYQKNIFINSKEPLWSVFRPPKKFT